MPIYLRTFLRVLSSWVHGVWCRETSLTPVSRHPCTFGPPESLIGPRRIERELADQLPIIGHDPHV
jgi:hypothetical protein